MSPSRSVVDEGLLFWIFADLEGVFGTGIEGSGFLLYSLIWSGSLGAEKARFADLGDVDTSSQSSESVGDGDDGPECSMALGMRSHSLINC